MIERICVVAVDTVAYAVDRLYDYRAPAELAEAAQVGCRVLVPFGKGNLHREGVIVLQRESKIEDSRLKPILSVLDDSPVLDGDMLKLAVYMRERLYCTFFDCVRAMLPTGLWFHRQETYQLAAQLDAATLAELHAKNGIKAQILACFTQETEALTAEQIAAKVHTETIAPYVQALCHKGILVRNTQVSQKSSDKTERMLTLALEPEEAMRRTEKGRSAVRADVISCLADGSAMSWKDVRYMTGASDAVLRTMVKTNLLHMFKEKRERTPDYTDILPAPPLVLSGAQQQVYDGLAALAQQEGAAAALLYGVTGSGKTQIYIQLIADAVARGQSAILLVPEIGLTPQMIRTFVGHFGGQVAVLHSALSIGERYDSWNKIREGRAKVVIGTRSAIFAPVQNLGILILDEEQDSAYKSEMPPRYHARDLAKYRAVQAKAFLVLGSATPSIESYYGAQQGKYPVFSLRERYQGTPLPHVVVADMRGVLRQGISGSIGPILHEELASNLQNGQQSILFLNRRGNSRTLTCVMCGWMPECPSCSTTLTYHSVNGRAMCHYCGYSIKVTGSCPECGSAHLQAEIPGTQKVEDELQEKFPQARVLRMDADTMGARGAHEKLLDTFGSGKADILLGTQMVTKGLDFERVTLVGVLDADQGLYAQDYRARERTFSLITQVVGRAGRRFAKGRAVIQTLQPSHPVILAAARQDYDAFYEMEIATRGALRHPPLEQILVLTASGELEQQVLSALVRLKKRMEGLMEGQFADFKYPILGPAPAGVVRVSSRYRYHLMLRCPEGKRRRALISGILREFARDKQNKGIALFADQNPETV